MCPQSSRYWLSCFWIFDRAFIEWDHPEVLFLYALSIKCAGLSSLYILPTIEVFIAEISTRSPRKLCIFIIYKNVFRIKVSKKIVNLILKKTSLLPTWVFAVQHKSHISGRFRSRDGNIPWFLVDLPFSKTTYFLHEYVFDHECRILLIMPSTTHKPGLSHSCGDRGAGILPLNKSPLLSIVQYGADVIR